jgi:hypothetical protein
MTERDDAIALANKVLDTPNRDPDDDLSMMSRQFLRAIEALAKLRPETVSEHIARDMREGRFPQRSEPQNRPGVAVQKLIAEINDGREVIVRESDGAEFIVLTVAMGAAEQWGRTERARADKLAALLGSIKWTSIDKDNMEFSATINCYQMDEIRAAAPQQPTKSGMKL